MNKMEAIRKYREYLIIHDTKILKCCERIAYKNHEYFIFEILFHEKNRSFIAVKFEDGDIEELVDSERDTFNEVKEFVEYEIKFWKYIEERIDKEIKGEKYEERRS